ncbi:bifunctional DNA primase/polymerase [Mycobacterium sp. Y57]|uniref:bifunctional DNA primase/polymerase n=1 Tax=Mycolicibacterium xanthum TaxID=2796469 RepID=UPI001C85A187|nr:bifunctional DNA primase/polymerase [Mycolicibacterium xanthum]MBX7434165.1 bifunctional DNA primase/polymerase [Mycolicibacterium xanthum]
MQSSRRNDLANEASAIRGLAASVLGATDIGTFAVEYAVHRWAIFPLNGKIPAIGRDRGGRGVLDATYDLDQVIEWWAGPYRGANIGGRVPAGMVVIDVDPRHGGDRSLTALEAEHGSLPATLTALSGRGDGGRHLYFRRPPGKLSSSRLGAGVDVKTSTGYTVLAPSIHPDTGKPYQWIEHPVADPPAWLAGLLRPEEPTGPQPQRRGATTTFTGPSPADQFSANTSWADILDPHGWRCLDGDPDGDGARWLHPAATSSCSATVRNGCLFVYSPNTPFDVTEAAAPRGYTRFRAHAVLNHAGDLKAAARAITNKEANR